MIRKVKSISMWLWHHLTPQIFAVICVFIITIIALFMPPYIGMADNGDFFRIFSSNGLFVNNTNYDALQFGHFVKELGFISTLMKTKWLYTPRKVSLFKWRFF